MNSHTEVKVFEIPECDICKWIGKEVKPAVADCAIKGGGWANVCEKHFKDQGCKLGLGLGQRFVLQQGAK